MGAFYSPGGDTAILAENDSEVTFCENPYGTMDNKTVDGSVE
jgi:hypothetical protein